MIKGLSDERLKIASIKPMAEELRTSIVDLRLLCSHHIRCNVGRQILLWIVFELLTRFFHRRNSIFGIVDEFTVTGFLATV